jgi:hypothetical protein
MNQKCWTIMCFTDILGTIENSRENFTNVCKFVLFVSGYAKGKMEAP